MPTQSPGLVASADDRSTALHTSPDCGSSKLGCVVQSTVVGPGRELSVGGTASVTVISCDEVALLPHSSVAVHVRTTWNVAEAPHPLGAEASVNARLATLQASKGRGVINVGVSGHCTLDGPGSEGNEGASVSCTVTVSDVVAVLLQASLAIQVRVTLYAPAHDPGAVESNDEEATEAPLQLSLALGLPNTGWLGQLMVVGASVVTQYGAVVSTTEMVSSVVVL